MLAAVRVLEQNTSPHHEHMKEDIISTDKYLLSIVIQDIGGGGIVLETAWLG